MTDQRVNAASAEVELETFGALRDKEPQKEPRSQWKDVWDQLRKHKGALIGGGFVAQSYATRHPDHIGGLILVSTAAKFDFAMAMPLPAMR